MYNIYCHVDQTLKRRVEFNPITTYYGLWVILS